MWGFAGGQIDHNFITLHGFAGPLEVVGGTLIVFGLFTRLAAFILCGQMAVAYFDQWAGRGFFPISNGGEEAVIFCFTCLWLVTAGPGVELDSMLGHESHLVRTLSGWEPWGRAIARIVLAFLFTLHGYRHVFGLFPKSAGRAAVVPLAIDKLPAFVGWWEIVGGSASAARTVHPFLRRDHLYRTRRGLRVRVRSARCSGRFATAGTRP